MNISNFAHSKRIWPNYLLMMVVVLMIFAIHFALWVSTKSIWGDEYYSVNLAQKTALEIMRTEVLLSNHPPSYLLLLSFWTKLFGVSELSFRSMSHFMNILMIAGSFLMAKEIFNRKTAILTAAFIGICPYFLHLSNEIRSYSTLSCFATFATYFFFKARNNPLRKIWKITYALFVLLTIYTEHFGWFCLFGISTYLLFILLTNWNHEKEWMWVQGLVFLISIPSVLLIFFQSLYDESVFLC